MAIKDLTLRNGILKRVNRSLVLSGLDLRKIVLSLVGVIPLLRDLARYRSGKSDAQMPVRAADLCLALADRYGQAGAATGHYFFQDLWAARKIFEVRPARHVDIGSSVEGFVSHLLVFMPQVEVVDVRPLKSSVPRLSFVRDDATLLSSFPDDSIDSISTLHAAEHFGLGRYGDRVDPEGHLKFMRSLVRVLKPGGRLYFAVPTGRERVEFNAHRVLAPNTILTGMAGLVLVSFSLVKDDQLFYENASLEVAAKQEFGCGLYEFTKK